MQSIFTLARNHLQFRGPQCVSFSLNSHERHLVSHSLSTFTSTKATLTFPLNHVGCSRVFRFSTTRQIPTEWQQIAIITTHALSFISTTRDGRVDFSVAPTCEQTPSIHHHTISHFGAARHIAVVASVAFEWCDRHFCP